MCGLAGLAVVGGGVLPPDAESRLRRMSLAVAHRGPDGERIHLDGPVGLAFRLLALVDADGAGQPIMDENETVALIANGEVYNYLDLKARLGGTRFRTTSDCEVLAHLYTRDGLRFLDDVRGMFAIALYDRRRGRLVLARDRFGIKPLYFARSGNLILFGSEIKALLEDPSCPRELDWLSALTDQCLHGAAVLTSDPVNTWFRGIEEVPAGTIVTIDLRTGDVSHQAYWELPSFDGASTASNEEIVGRYRDLLTFSVAECASAAAEVGLLLSGGVDSASVAALAARQGRIHTFTALTGSTLVNGDGEAAHQAAMALGLPNHQVLFEATRIPAADEWKRLLWLLETPLCGPEQYYKYEIYRYARTVRPRLKGMMLGQASDEFNGGYSAQISWNAGWAGFEEMMADMARAKALHALPSLLPWREHHETLVISDEVLRQYAARMLDDPYSAFVRWKYRDLQQYNCWHEDRTAAGNGIEARVPFLDHRIVELMATIPACRRARLLWDKTVLREAVRHILPAESADRPKVPFYQGAGSEHTHRIFIRMLSQDNGALLEEALAAPSARDYLRPDAIRGMLGRLRQTTAPTGSEFLLRLVNLGLLDQMVRSLPAPPASAPHGAVPPSANITDWPRDITAVVPRLRHITQPRLGELIRFVDDALAVQAPAEPEILYVAVNGQFEYVIDSRDEPQWHAFLRHVDTKNTLGEVLEASGVRLSEVSGLLAESLDMGLLVQEPTAVRATVEPVPAA